jgi:hypothetical protein
MNEAQTQTRHTGQVSEMDVRYLSGESYEVVVRGHRVPTDQPAEAAGADSVRLTLRAPGLPDERRGGLLAVASHCTVHNCLANPPDVRIELAGHILQAERGGRHADS